MLDRAKIIEGLNAVSDQLFIDNSQALALAYQGWLKILADSHITYKIRLLHDYPFPLWDGYIGEIVPLSGTRDEYRIVGIDGSQIYPDNYQGTSCSLINIGLAAFFYSKFQSQATLYSRPTVIVDAQRYESAAIDYINNYRLQLELEAALCDEFCNTNYILFDGSLLWWHIDMNVPGSEQFFNSYIAILNSLYERKKITAWYCSLPRHKELINLIKIAICDFNSAWFEHYNDLEGIIDCHILSSHLVDNSRSTLFETSGTLSNRYPHHLKPHFFYLKSEFEIGRVEIPAWIGQDRNYLDRISSILLDQINKGRGYPIALAEAHEQAVVKGADRDFFYYLIQKMSANYRKKMTISQKNLKKRYMSI